jgi:uncharacterized membrane protein
MALERGVVSELIILTFRDRNAAFTAAEHLGTLQQAAGTEPEDIVVVTRNAAGGVSVNHLTDGTTGRALGGGGWGTLIALLFLDDRTARSAERGPAAQFLEAGLERQFLEEAAHALDKTGAVVGMRVRLLGPDRVIERARSLDGIQKVIRARLSGEAEDRLIDMQDQIPPGVMALVQG